MLNVDQLESRGYRFFIVSVIMPILDTICVLARLWVRSRITKSLGIDDWLLLLSLVCSDPRSDENDSMADVMSSYSL
jgi:hypothetical protein